MTTIKDRHHWAVLQSPMIGNIGPAQLVGGFKTASGAYFYILRHNQGRRRNGPSCPANCFVSKRKPDGTFESLRESSERIMNEGLPEDVAAWWSA